MTNTTLVAAALATATTLTFSCDTYAQEQPEPPAFLVIEQSGLSCSLMQESDYICSTTNKVADDAGTDTVILGYRDIIKLGGTAYVPRLYAIAQN